MTVIAIKSVEESTVKKLRLHLSNECECKGDMFDIIIDEEGLSFTAMLFNNTAYTMSLSAENPIETLVDNLENDPEHLYERLHNEILDETINVAETTETLMNHIKNSKEYQENSKNYLPLQIMKAEIESVLCRHYPFNLYMVDYVWEKWFDGYINDNLLPNLDTLKANDYDLFELEGDFMCSLFCYEYAPIIAKAIKTAYKL